MSPRVLNRQLRTTKVTVPLGTAQAAPASTQWDLGNVIVETLEIMIPKGHSGLTGIHVDYQGVALIPFAQPAVFLVAADETITVPVDLEIGAALTVVAYNTDVFDHAFYLRALVDVLLGQDTTRDYTPALIDLSAVRA
jgi:hypothetical protein